MLTIQDCERMIAVSRAANSGADSATTRVYKQLLATMKREGKLRTALVTIRDAMDSNGNDYYDGWTFEYRKIADAALASCEYPVLKDSQ